MPKIQNLYKLSGVFRCVHDVHRNFKSNLSPFYILLEKNCYPHGCVYFKWKCRLLAKQKTCFRGFSHVGKKCFNCRYFYEEKQHFYPQYIYTEKNSDAFTEEFNNFNAWVNQLKQKRVICEGTVSAVSPNLFIRKTGHHHQLHMIGFIIRVTDGYIDNHPFSDAYYLSISPLTQNKLAFRKGDLVEFVANLTIDRGRFKFVKPGHFQFYQRGQEKPVTKGDILVSLKTYSVQREQPEKCIHCYHGLLVDIKDTPGGPSRTIVCLQGVADHHSCLQHVHLSEDSEENQCINADWGRKLCHHVL